MRTQETLDILRERGANGIKAEELSTKFGHVIPGSVSKLITLLRAKGHTIISDRAVGYVLTKENIITEAPRVKRPYNRKEKPAEDSGGTVPEHKKYQILEVIRAAGAAGSNPSDLAKVAAIKERSVCYHIHILRKEGHSILFKGGMYVLKGSKRVRPPESSPVSANVQNDAVDLKDIADTIGNKRLIQGINKIKNADKPAYVDLLRKIFYYTRCATAMLDTNVYFETLTEDI